MSLILTCPQCATRYVAKPEGFKPPGRNVRCSKCDHMWYQEVAAPESYETLYDLYEGEGGTRTANRNHLPFEHDRGGHHEEKQRRSFFRRNKSRQRASLEDDIASFRPYARERRSRSGLFTAFVAVAVLGSLATGLVLFGPLIKDKVPSLSGVLNVLPKPSVGNEFNFENTAYSRVMEQGQDVLIVSGEIINNGEEAVPMPTIRAILRDAEDQQVDEWLFTPRGNTLEPGEARYFESRRYDPPLSAYRLHLIVVEES